MPEAQPIQSANHKHARKIVLVVGSANLDTVVSVPRLPMPGETLASHGTRRQPGGKGANQAAAAACAGAEVMFFCALGDDPGCALMLSALKSRGVRTATAPLREGVPTGEAWIFLADDGSNFIAVHPGANGAVQRGDIADARLPFDQAAILLLQMEIAPEANREAARRARKAGIPVLLNYAPADFFDPELLKVADILVVNETEAERLAAQCPGRLTEDRIPQIRDLGPGIILVTFGSDGSRLITPGSDTRIPAYAVTPTDTTAAGDTFCGALAARFAETGCLDHDSVEFASAAAALSVTRPGAMDSVPVRPEIDDFLRRQRGI